MRTSIFRSMRRRDRRVRKMAPQFLRKKYNKYGVLEPLVKSQSEYVVVPRNLQGHQQLLTIG